MIARAGAAAAVAVALAQTAADPQAALQTRVDETVADARFPGMTAAIVLPDDRTFVVASGWADAARTVKLRPSDRMPAGSVGKSFVAAAILQAVEAGTLDLDAPISRWLGSEPWFSRLPNSGALTLRLLLGHRSGIPETEDTMSFVRAITTDPDRTWMPADLIALTLDKKPRFPAGQKYFYTDTNYIVAGAVFERATGERLFDAIQRRILTPLGLDQTVPSERRDMTDVVPGLLDVKGPLAAVGLTGESIRRGRFVYDAQAEYAGGGLISSSRDLARAAKAIFEGRAFSQPLLAQMLDGKPADEGTTYGLGVQIVPSAAGPLYFHDGWVFGYQSVMMYLPNHRVAAAIQINSDPSKTHKVRPIDAGGRVAGTALRLLGVSIPRKGPAPPV
jgi:D-alanyl-D-alanine carboxypeptidase